jgi:hypothetical protein
MKNPQPRFAYDEDDDTIFDYATSKSHPATGTLDAPDGQWDLAKVKELILAGKSIETAYAGAADKVEQSSADFLTEEPAVTGGEIAGDVTYADAEYKSLDEEPKGE